MDNELETGENELRYFPRVFGPEHTLIAALLDETGQGRFESFAEGRHQPGEQFDISIPQTIGKR
jgi:hypothetical protein